MSSSRECVDDAVAASREVAAATRAKVLMRTGPATSMPSASSKLEPAPHPAHDELDDALHQLPFLFGVEPRQRHAALHRVTQPLHEALGLLGVEALDVVPIE